MKLFENVRLMILVSLLISTLFGCVMYDSGESFSWNVTINTDADSLYITASSASIPVKHQNDFKPRWVKIFPHTIHCVNAGDCGCPTYIDIQNTDTTITFLECNETLYEGFFNEINSVWYSEVPNSFKVDGEPYP